MPSKFFRKSLEKIPLSTTIFVRKYVDVLKRIHDLLEQKGYSLDDLEELIGESYHQEGYNFSLKTISKLEAILEEEIISVTAPSDKLEST